MSAGGGVHPMADLTDDQRMKALYYFAGVLGSIHEKLDSLRDAPGEHDPRNALDHNIEQIQINVEVAMMRTEQLTRLIGDRMDAAAEKVDGTHER